jgi:uncharacterized membrane protein YheB (UPF0754 family)
VNRSARRFIDKGTFSNILSGAVFGVGLLLPAGTLRDFTLSIGLFAFSGGITNALAVKMLFDRIPGLVGSGVIPARFREIREKIKSLILEHFFNESYLRDFLAQEKGNFDWRSFVKTGGAGRGPMARLVDRHWERFTGPETLDPIIEREIERLMDSRIGGLLAMVGAQNVKPAVSQFVGSFVGSLKGKVIELADKAGPEDLEVEIDEARVVAELRRKVKVLLDRKIAQLEPATVKRMMEDVIRDHLGWLVVWGNVFGAVLGIVGFVIQRYQPS